MLKYLDCHFVPQEKRTNKYYHYMEGLNIPADKLVHIAGIIHPESETLFYHPFWFFIDDVPYSLNILYEQLERLPNDISSRIFYYNDYLGEKVRNRYERNTHLLNYLDERGDFDALAACLGLIREAQHHSSVIQWQEIAITAMRVFKRVYCSHPYNVLLSGIFDFLSDDFFHFGGKYIEYDRSTDFSSKKALYDIILETINDLNLERKLHDYEIRQCLYLTDHEMTTEWLAQIYRLRNEGKRSKLHKHPFFKKIKETLNVSHFGPESERWRPKPMQGTMKSWHT